MKLRRIQALDLRPKDGVIKSLVEATTLAIEAIFKIWEAEECWIEWDEIEWEFTRQRFDASDMIWRTSNPTWTHLIVPGAGIFEIERDGNYELSWRYTP